MKRIAFLHPDLGIGGAERAIVDAAIALKHNNFNVTIFTNHHNHKHCFDETINGELNVKVFGDFIPRMVFGRFCALFAYLRFIVLSLYVLLFNSGYDIFYVDQITAPIPILKLFGYKVLFYAHFPDFLLSKSEGKLKRLYRIPINALEKFSMSFADVILFNSNFTKSVYEKYFSDIGALATDIVYPVPNFSNLVSSSSEDPLADVLPNDAIVFLSINRYEEKKNIKLAIEAFAHLLHSAVVGDNVHLVHMGGYDNDLLENLKTYEHLMYFVREYKMTERVHLLKSCSNDVKVNYLQRATALLYTPSMEHFGIVPIESMFLGLPVIAVDNGGPTETVLHGQTGFLCEAKPAVFAEAMTRFIKDDTLKEKLGTAGRERVMKHFGFPAFEKKLSKIVSDMTK